MNSFLRIKCKMSDSTKNYPNILDSHYRFNDFLKVEIDNSSFPLNYYFLNFLLWYLEYDLESDEYVNKIPFKENTISERVYNAALFYLELFCEYEMLIQGARFDYKFYPYSSFKEWDFDEIEERLDINLNSWFLSLNHSFQKFEINDFNDDEALNKITTQLDPLYKSCHDRLLPKITELNYEWLTHEELLKTILKEGDKTALGEYAPIFRILNHTQHSDFKLNQRSFNMKFESKFNNKDFSSLNNSVRFFDIESIHTHFQQICTSYLKLGLIDDMKFRYQFQNKYNPSIYKVSGPTDAVKRFSRLIMDEYNVYTKDDLARKLYVFCNLIDETGDTDPIQVLNIDSLKRIIHRYVPEIFNSNNCKK